MAHGAYRSPCVTAAAVEVWIPGGMVAQGRCGRLRRSSIDAGCHETRPPWPPRASSKVGRRPCLGRAPRNRPSAQSGGERGCGGDGGGSGLPVPAPAARVTQPGVGPPVASMADGAYRSPCVTVSGLRRARSARRSWRSGASRGARGGQSASPLQSGVDVSNPRGCTLRFGLRGCGNSRAEAR